MPSLNLLTNELDDLQRMAADLAEIKSRYDALKTRQEELRASEQEWVAKQKGLGEKILATPEFSSHQDKRKQLLEEQMNLTHQLAASDLTEIQQSELKRKKQTNEQNLTAINEIIESHTTSKENHRQTEIELTRIRSEIASNAADLIERAPELNQAEENKQQAMWSVIENTKVEIEKVSQHPDRLTEYIWLHQLQTILKHNGVVPDAFQDLSEQKEAREAITKIDQQLNALETSLTKPERKDFEVFQNTSDRITALKNSIGKMESNLEQERQEKASDEQTIRDLASKKPLSSGERLWYQIALTFSFIICPLIAVIRSLSTGEWVVVFFVAIFSVVVGLVINGAYRNADVEAKRAQANASFEINVAEVHALEASLEKDRLKLSQHQQERDDMFSRHPDLRQLYV